MPEQGTTDDLAARLAEAFEREQQKARTGRPAPAAPAPSVDTDDDGAEPPPAKASARPRRRTTKAAKAVPAGDTTAPAELTAALAEQRELLAAVERRLAEHEALPERLDRIEATLAQLADLSEDLGLRFDELAERRRGGLFGGRARRPGT